MIIDVQFEGSLRVVYIALLLEDRPCWVLLSVREEVAMGQRVSFLARPCLRCAAKLVLPCLGGRLTNLRSWEPKPGAEYR